MSVTLKKFGNTNTEYRVSASGQQATIVPLDTKIDLTSGFAHTRVAFIRVDIKHIDAALAQVKSAIEKGTARVAVHDYLESDPEVQHVFGVSAEFPFEKAIQPYLRSTGENGVNFTCKGERIVRKGIFDEHGTIEDVIIQHDNHAQIAAHRAEAKAATKATPVAETINLAAASVVDAELPGA